MEQGIYKQKDGDILKIVGKSTKRDYYKCISLKYKNDIAVITSN